MFPSLLHFNSLLCNNSQNIFYLYLKYNMYISICKKSRVIYDNNLMKYRLVMIILSFKIYNLFK